MQAFRPACHGGPKGPHYIQAAAAARVETSVSSTRNCRSSATGLIAGLLIAAAATLTAADKVWQTGAWGEILTKRQMVDFGPGSSPFGNPTSSPSMKALADVYVYIIETNDLHLEAEDLVPVGRRSVEVIPGGAVTFALEKKAVYVRDADGTEHKLRVTKKVPRKKS